MSKDDGWVKYDPETRRVARCGAPDWYKRSVQLERQLTAIIWCCNVLMVLLAARIVYLIWRIV
jgi:hypothetical protein